MTHAHAKYQGYRPGSKKHISGNMDTDGWTDMSDQFAIPGFVVSLMSILYFKTTVLCLSDIKNIKLKLKVLTDYFGNNDTDLEVLDTCIHNSLLS